MFPIDSARPTPPGRRSSAAPPYVDEDPNTASVEQGLAAAENDLRDAVADSYEESAAGSEEELNDIDYAEAEDKQTPSELEAMHREQLPRGE